MYFNQYQQAVHKSYFRSKVMDYPHLKLPPSSQDSELQSQSSSGFYAPDEASSTTSTKKQHQYFRSEQIKQNPKMDPLPIYKFNKSSKYEFRKDGVLPNDPYDPEGKIKPDVLHFIKKLEEMYKQREFDRTMSEIFSEKNDHKKIRKDIRELKEKEIGNEESDQSILDAHMSKVFGSSDCSSPIEYNRNANPGQKDN